MTKKMRNCDFLINKPTFQKVAEVEPPIFFNLRGSYFINFFKILLVSEIWDFGLKIYQPTLLPQGVTFSYKCLEDDILTVHTEK